MEIKKSFKMERLVVVRLITRPWYFSIPGKPSGWIYGRRAIAVSSAALVGGW